MPYFDVKEILSVAINFIDKHGFDSSKTSNNPTWKQVSSFIQSNSKSPVEGSFIYRINTNIEDESIKIIEWVRSLNNKTQYISTVKNVIERGYCGKHLFGLLISIIPIYREHNKVYQIESFLKMIQFDTLFLLTKLNSVLKFAL